MRRSACSLAFALLLGCAGERTPVAPEVPDPTPSIAATAVGGPEPPPEVPQTPECHDVSTPDLPLEGRGLRWTEMLGGPANDFPGTGAVLSTIRGAGPLTTLQEADRTDLCAVPLPDEGLGYATTLTTADFGAIDRAATRGASLVFVPSATAAAEACGARVAASGRNEALHVGVDATLAEALAESELLDLARAVRVRGVGPDDRPRLRLLADSLRARGARLVVAPEPFAEAPEVLAELLLGGAVLELDVAPTKEVEAALRVLRDRPELVDRVASELGVLWSAGHITPDDFDATASALDRLGAPFRVVLGGDRHRLRGAVEKLTTVVVPAPADDSSDAVLREFGGRGNVWSPADLTAGALDRLLDDVLDARVTLEGGAAVRVARFTAPGEGLLIHHLLADGRFEGGRLELAQFESGAAIGCRAELIEPFAGRTHSIGCAPVGERFEVAVPAFAHWGIVTVRLVGAHPVRADSKVVRIVGGTSPGRERWAELTLEAPQWPAGAIHLGFPEEIRSVQGPVDFGVSPLIPTWTEIDGGFRYEASNERVTVSGALLSEADGLRTSMTITNSGTAPLERVEALICLDVEPPLPFPSSGHGRTFVPVGEELVRLDTTIVDSGDPLYIERDLFSHPLTVLESVDRRWVLGNAFEGSEVVGGNAATGVCVHSRPRFGDLAPGDSVERKGRLWVGRGTADDVLASYLADPLEEAPRRVDPVPWRRPCSEPQSSQPIRSE